MTREKMERAMEMLAAMTVLDIAEAEGREPAEVYREFRRSRTFEELFDAETGLWSNGPVYITDEYGIERGGIA